MPVPDNTPSPLVTDTTSDAGKPSSDQLLAQLDSLLSLHKTKIAAVESAVLNQDQAVAAVKNLSDMVNTVVSTLGPLVGKIGTIAPSSPHAGGLVGTLGTVSSALGSLSSIHTSLKGMIPGMP